MFTFNSEDDAQKLVLFYIIFTIAYIPILISIIVWTVGLNAIGTFSFKIILLLIIAVETLKYFISRSIIPDYTISNKRSYQKKLTNATKSIFSWIRIKEGIKTCLVMVTSILVYTVIGILFGAALAEMEATIMFATLLAILTIYPLCLISSQSIDVMLLNFKAKTVLEALLLQNVIFTIVGNWVGCVALPLDWDRPWQKWPIPCCYSGIIAFYLSHVCMVFSMGKFVAKKER